MRILIIDDDALVLRALKRLLRAHTISTTTAASDALVMIENGQTFDAILCDLNMPDMSGRAFYRALEAFAPDLARRVVFTTGGALNRADDDLVETHAKLMKPFTGAELHHALLPLAPLHPASLRPTSTVSLEPRTYRALISR